MSGVKFCTETESLLYEQTEAGELQFKSREGKIYSITTDDTMLDNEELGDAAAILKFDISKRVTAFDFVNPKTEKECMQCHRKIVSFQRLGEQKKIVYACVCGNIFEK